MDKVDVMKPRLHFLVVCALAGLLSAPASIAQSERSGNDTARVMQQLQQVTAERTALQADKDRLQKEVDNLKAQLAPLQEERGALTRKAQVAEAAAARLAGSSEANSAAVERSRVQMQDLVTRFRETAQNLQDVEADRNAARGLLAAKDQELKVCIDRNAGLYSLNSEMLEQMEGRGFWSGVGEREPFTRLARTRLENLIDDYRYRVEELRLEKQKEQSAPVVVPR